MWSLETGKKDEKHGFYSIFAILYCFIVLEGVEAIYTFRGHLGAVICMDLSPTGDNLYSGMFIPLIL